jgi:hypothetical protein
MEAKRVRQNEEHLLVRQEQEKKLQMQNEIIIRLQERERLLEKSLYEQSLKWS